MTKDFATRLSKSIFSDADIQRFLLLKKWNLEKALTIMNHWAKNKLIVKSKQKSENMTENCTSSFDFFSSSCFSSYRAFVMIFSSSNFPISQASFPIKLFISLSFHQVSLLIKLFLSSDSSAHWAFVKLLSLLSFSTHQAFHFFRHQCLCYSLLRWKRCHW